MSAPPRSTALLRAAGPLTAAGFTTAILHAARSLERGRTVPGLDRPLSFQQLVDAAPSAVDPYCDGDRAGAEEALAKALAPGWAPTHPAVRARAGAHGRAVLLWLEAHDPARN